MGDWILNANVRIIANFVLDSPTLKPLLKRLASADFISRTRSSVDEREV